MSGWTKLQSSIVHSTIWREPHHVRIVWITMLALCDSKGKIEGSIPGLADISRCTMEECLDALNKLLSPDEWSRDPDNGGRRIEEIPGGWIVLNYGKYRDPVSTPRVHAHREKEKQAKQCETVSGVSKQAKQCETHETPSESDTESEAYSKSEEKEEEQLALLPPSQPKPKPSRAHQLPEDWVCKKSHCELARELGVGIETESVKFREHAIATGRTMKNWDMAFNTWLRRSAEFQRSRPGRKAEQAPQYDDLNKIFGRVIPDGTNTPK